MHPRTRRIHASASALLRLCVVTSMLMLLPLSLSADEPVFATDGVALSGYDVVAYFTQGKAVRGDPVVSHRWQGVDWFFSSAEHRTLFMADPDRYVPRYGGFCGLGAAHGGLVPSSPTAWSIHKGELVLNMNQDVVETWRYNPDTHIERADNNWPGMRERYIAKQAQQ